MAKRCNHRPTLGCRLSIDHLRSCDSRRGTPRFGVALVGQFTGPDPAQCESASRPLALEVVEIPVGGWPRITDLRALFRGRVGRPAKAPVRPNGIRLVEGVCAIDLLDWRPGRPVISSCWASSGRRVCARRGDRNGSDARAGGSNPCCGGCCRPSCSVRPTAAAEAIRHAG